MRREWTARAAVIFILAGMPLLILGYQVGLRPLLSPMRVVDVIAAVPEAGGFQPAGIQVSAGETVTLRFRSVDVTHGIAIGPGLGIDLGHADPGKTQEITLTFDQAGTFTFYCTTWCSPNHWRMRGVLEVRDPAGGMPIPPRDPVIERLAAEGIDIDAMADTDQPHQAVSPSLANGAAVAARLDIPAELLDLSWRQTHTPEQALALLTARFPDAPHSDLVDVVAYLWRPTTAPSEQTVRLYEQNCASCHGQYGQGDGFAASTTAAEPIAFTDLAHMFARRSDVLYAKIRRGGMGTDMPNFGTLFTPDETWALVDYVWLLALN